MSIFNFKFVTFENSSITRIIEEKQRSSYTTAGLNCQVERKKAIKKKFLIVELKYESIKLIENIN